MKFALYQPWIYLHGGLERSILELVRRSRHEWVIYTGHYDPNGAFPEFRKLDVRVIGKTSVRRNFRGVISSAIDVLGVKLPLESSVDGVVVWCDGIGDLITFRNGNLPLYNICSTPLRAAFDPVYQEALTEGMSTADKLMFSGFRAAFRFIDRLAWRKYKGIITTSTEVKNRILTGRLANRFSSMVMAYPGIEWNPSPPDHASEPFMLLSGRIMWTKNIEQAIRAFLLDPPPAPWRLVIAGYVDQKSEEYLTRLRDLAKENSRIEFVVRPTDAELLALNQRASFCLFTPLNEDWGIVPLEAMAQGKAVIANARGGPLESIVHGQTGLLVQPFDREWSAAIHRLTSNVEWTKQLGRQAHLHVGKFTWRKFTQIVDDSLEEWTVAHKVRGIFPGSNPPAPTAS